MLLSVGLESSCKGNSRLRRPPEADFQDFQHELPLLFFGLKGGNSSTLLHIGTSCG